MRCQTSYGISLHPKNTSDHLACKLHKNGGVNTLIVPLYLLNECPMTEEISAYGSQPKVWQRVKG